VSLDAEPIAVTLRVTTELERLGIEYLVGASIASSVHGRPRTTQDVDLVARTAGRHISGLFSALEQDFYIDADMIAEAIRSRSSFNSSASLTCSSRCSLMQGMLSSERPG